MPFRWLVQHGNTPLKNCCVRDYVAKVTLNKTWPKPKMLLIELLCLSDKGIQNETTKWNEFLWSKSLHHYGVAGFVLCHRGKVSQSMTIYTTEQVAKLCKVAPRTVSKWFDSGRLRGYRIPCSQDRRIPHRHLVRFLKEHGMTGILKGIQDEESDWNHTL